MPKHKFAEKWRAWTVNFNPAANPFGSRGEMDLRLMDDKGKLAKGEHYTDENGKPHEIEGEATQNDIQLRRTDGIVSWKGLLIFEDTVGNLGIVGKKSTLTERADSERGGESPFFQDEEPWVITKP